MTWMDDDPRTISGRSRSAEVDAAYAAYEARPVCEPDEWGDLASWRAAAGAS